MSEGIRGQVAYITGLGSRASEWLFYTLIFVFPFFVLPITIFPVALNKSYLLYFSILIIGVIHLASSLQSGTLKIPKSVGGIFLLVFVVSLIASSLFSVSTHSSFSGLGSEPGTLSAIGIFVLTLILAFMVLDSEEKVLRSLFALFGSFFILLVFQIFQTLIKLPILSSLGREATFNLFGSWNELGIFAGLIALISVILLGSLPKSFLKVVLWFVLISSLSMVALINFQTVWWVLAAMLIVMLAYNYSQKRNPGSMSRVAFVVLLISLVFIFAGDIASDMVSQMGINSLEARPDLSSTLKTASGALGNNAAFGYGPNTFLYAWFDFRSSDSLNSPFWQTRFNTGYGYVPTLLATTGLISVVSLLAFLGFFLYYGFKALVKLSSSSSFLILTGFVGALYLWVFAFIYSGGFSLLFFTFLLSGIFLGLAMKRGILDYYEISLFEHSVSGFIGALSLIFFIVLGVSWVSILAQKYYASILYGEGIAVMSSGDFGRSENLLNRAIRFDKRDLYLRSFVDLGILRLQRIVSGASGAASQEDVQEQFRVALDQSIASAQEASKINSADAANWMSLGRIYEAVVPLQIQGAANLALEAYNRASVEFPTSPEPLLAQARVEIARNDLPRAKEFLQKAISLKQDFAEAHFLIAQIETASGNTSAAILSAETTARLAPRDVGVLFQLGLLYYQDSKFEQAQAVFERAVSINANYSNARYFLGLIYSRNGDRTRALAEFQKIRELNPGNAEVLRIIENLSTGRDPLSGIPPPSPEDRSSAPVDN